MFFSVFHPSPLTVCINCSFLHTFCNNSYARDDQRNNPEQVIEGSTVSSKICERRRHHVLRGSASPVLTATGLVNGRWRFSTPTESTPLTDRQKMSQVITSATPTGVPNLVHIHPWGPLGEYVNYNYITIFFYLYLFFGN